MNVDLDQLVDLATIAERLGVGRTAVDNWRARFDDFPKPVKVFGEGSRRQAVYLWWQVHAWAQHHDRAT